jgi:hypothetical protein
MRITINTSMQKSIHIYINISILHQYINTKINTYLHQYINTEINTSLYQCINTK